MDQILLLFIVPKFTKIFFCPTEPPCFGLVPGSVGLIFCRVDIFGEAGDLFDD